MKGPYGVELWTVKDTQFVIDNHDTMSNEDIAMKLERTVDSVRQKILRLRRRGVPLELKNQKHDKRRKPKTRFDPRDVRLYCMTTDSCQFKTVEHKKRNWSPPIVVKVQTCGKHGYCPHQACPRLLL